jgi:hypothetical protein
MIRVLKKWGRYGTENPAKLHPAAAEFFCQDPVTDEKA